MLALCPRVVDAVWAAVEGHIPKRLPTCHPLGCHRPRIPDRDCFEGILIRLVTGCSWDVAARLSRPGETTLRNRCNEWMAAGVFDRLAEEALAAYDRIIGFDLEDAALDCSQQKAPMGGEGTGPNYQDRNKQGWKWSLLTDREGIPIGWVEGPANRHDSKLMADTLDDAARRGLLVDVVTVHLDRGYSYAFVREECRQRGLNDVLIPAKRKGLKWGKRRRPNTTAMGERWPIERTNSWLTNFGQMRRNTDRRSQQRRGQLNLAIAIVITIKLVKWADRWQRA